MNETNSKKKNIKQKILRKELKIAEKVEKEFPKLSVSKLSTVHNFSDKNEQFEVETTSSSFSLCVFPKY
jgi:hypothetical protein